MRFKWVGRVGREGGEGGMNEVMNEVMRRTERGGGATMGEGFRGRFCVLGGSMYRYCKSWKAYSNREVMIFLSQLGGSEY